MFIKSSDVIRLFLKQKGNGTAAIFIHGGPGAWFESFKEAAGEKLEDIFPVIYFDQRGCGRSEGSMSTDFSLDRLVEDIKEFILEKLSF